MRRQQIPSILELDCLSKAISQSIIDVTEAYAGELSAQKAIEAISRIQLACRFNRCHENEHKETLDDLSVLLERIYLS